MLGKVMARVFLNGDRWKPLQPLTPVFRDGEVLIPFHVPVAPLVLDTPWSAVAPTAVPNSGIVLYDDAGTIPITAVEVVAPRVLRVKSSIALDAARNPRLRVGGQTVAGRTGIRDSDPTLATDSYEYTAGSGQDPSENVAALVGKPYSLANWCALCDIPITKAA